MAIPLNIMQGLRRVKLVYFLQPLTVEKPKKYYSFKLLIKSRIKSFFGFATLSYKSDLVSLRDYFKKAVYKYNPAVIYPSDPTYTNCRFNVERA